MKKLRGDINEYGVFVAITVIVIVLFLSILQYFGVIDWSEIASEKEVYTGVFWGFIAMMLSAEVQILLDVFLDFRLNEKLLISPHQLSIAIGFLVYFGWLFYAWMF